MLNDLAVGGVYLPPIAQALLLATPVFLLLNRGLRRLGAFRFIWHDALFEGALYAIVCATVVLSMGSLVR
ncbi:DUF1656 domain-containing protein [Pseudomonas sp. REB1044]|uniref:DUF1656 domain-containing protein n=1 Tax=Pseudomonas sp. REB1044 TaxID=2675224 RepID=UPI00315C4D98